MTRARLLKPGFFLNEDLAELPPLARILFAGLWCIADRAGRLEDRPKRIKHETLPYDEADVDELLAHLHEAGFILRYEADGARYIQVVNFARHQSPHIHEAQSVIPAYGQPSDTSDASTIQAPYKHDTRTPYPNPIAVPNSVSNSETVDTSSSEGDDSGSANIVADALASSDADEIIPSEPSEAATPSKPESKPERVTFAPDAPAMRLAIQLREAVLAHNSTAMDARKAMSGAGIQAWARKLDTLISDPRRAPPDVEAVIAFATQAGFWQAIVLNPDKLKKHYDTINGQRLKAMRTAQQAQETGGNGNGQTGSMGRAATAQASSAYRASAIRGGAGDVQGHRGRPTSRPAEDEWSDERVNALRADRDARRAAYVANGGILPDVS